MSSRVGRLCVLITVLAMTLVIAAGMCVQTVFAENDGRLTVADKCIAENGEVLEENMPEGMDFDMESRTLTLTDCTLDVTGVQTDSYIWATQFQDLTIVLNGTNEFKGAVYSDPKYTFYGIQAFSELTIKGTGTLSIDLSGCSHYATGIEAMGNLTIGDSESAEGVTSIEIKGGEEAKTGAFTGIDMHNDQGFYTGDGKSHAVSIRRAKVDISGSQLAEGEELYGITGIRTFDADMDIEDSIVNIDLT